MFVWSFVRSFVSGELASRCVILVLGLDFEGPGWLEQTEVKTETEVEVEHPSRFGHRLRATRSIHTLERRVFPALFWRMKKRIIEPRVSRPQGMARGHPVPIWV